MPAVIVSGQTAPATLDADAVVSIATWQDFDRLRRALESRGSRRGSVHQMFSAEDVEVNLIPFGEGIVRDRKIQWPGGMQMSALGLAEVLETAIPVRLENDVEFDVVPIPAFVLLKLIAYQDRAEERPRDVADIIACCEEYELDSARRCDASGEVVDGVMVSFDEAGAFIPGRDIAAIARPDSKNAVTTFFEGVQEQLAPAVSHVVAQEHRQFLDGFRLSAQTQVSFL